MTTTTNTKNSADTLLAAAQSAAKSAAKTNATSTASSTSSTADSLSSLTSNFNQFLTLLTTQLQNQDPSNPMSSDTFTSELAQFAGVEQQVQTNTNLSTLINITQNGQAASDMSLTGKVALANSSKLPLQNGSATLEYSTTSGKTLSIAISDSSGNIVKTDTFNTTSSSGEWDWDGKNSAGEQLADGQYNVAVETIDDSGNTSAVPFNVRGIVTGITRSGNNQIIDMGETEIPMSDVVSYDSAASGS